MNRELHTVSPDTYVAAINQRLALQFPELALHAISYEIQGAGRGERIHLLVPDSARQATMQAVYDLRQEGIFCFPILSPLGDAAIQNGLA